MIGKNNDSMRNSCKHLQFIAVVADGLIIDFSGQVIFISKRQIEYIGHFCLLKRNQFMNRSLWTFTDEFESE